MPPRCTDGSGLRERALAGGVGTLADADLLALLLPPGRPGRSATTVAATILEDVGGPAGLVHAGPALLAEYPAVGTPTALRIAAAVELGVRAGRPAPVLPRLGNSGDVARFMAPRLAGLRHEEMWMIGLDGHNHPRTPRRVSQGGRSSSPVCAADVLRPAIGDAATGIIVVHNHPSGDPSPSSADLGLTRSLAEGARAVGIVLVDHVIVCPSGQHVSLLDCGIVTQR